MAGRKPLMLVGREAEQAALQAAWVAAHAGLAQVVLVGGEAGIGKTALLAQFTAELPDEALVLRGQCVDVGGRGLPYAPLIGVLTDLIRQVGREALIRLAGAWRADLARLVPDLGPAAGEVEAGRSRLFQGVVSLLEQTASRRPVVLVVEDLHWADESTLELLRFAVRTLRDGRLMLAGTYRSDELTRRHPLTPVLVDLVTADRVTQLLLPRLGADEAAGLVRRRLGAPADAALVGSLVARSEGVPFYAEELASTAAQGVGGLPTTLAEVLSARLSELTEDSRRVLEAAAVGGTDIGEDDVAAVLDVTGDRVDGALREGIDRHILAVTADAAGVRFRHALLREAVLDGLLPGRLATLHRRWADHLGAKPAAEVDAGLAVRVAQHWRAAHDADNAFAASLTAAGLLRSAAAPDEELRMLEQALGLWDAVAAPHLVAGSDRAAVQQAAASAASQAGEWDRAMQFQIAALASVDPDREPVRYASMRLERLRLTEPLGQEVSDETEHVLAMLPPSAPDTEAGRVRARAMAMLARGRVMQGEYVAGEGLAREAVDYARRAGERLAEAHALNLLGNALDGLGRSDEALVVRYERQPLVEEIDDPFVKAGAQHNLSVTLALLGRLRESADAARSGRTTAARLGLGRSEGAAYAALEAESRIELGEWDTAVDLCEQALAAGPGPQEAIELAVLAATVAVWRGDPTAPQKLERADVWMRRTDDAWHILPYTTLRARAALEADDRVAAAVVLAEALHDPKAVFHPYSAGRFLHTAARALGDTGESADPPLDALSIDEVTARLEALPPSVEAPVWRALCAAELADPELALTTWTTCAHVLAAGQEGFAYERAHAHYRLGRAQAATGAPDAFATLRAAQQQAERLRALPLLRRVTMAVQSGQTPAPGRRPRRRAAAGNPYGLTNREQEVLALVGQGLSNTDIARRLFISPKTASVHVTNILFKVGVENRVAAATKAHELGLIDQPAQQPNRHRAGPGQATHN